MANPNVPNESGWVQIRREGYPVRGFSPIITLRPRGAIGLSADFVRLANIKDCTHCEIYVSTDARKLGFRFLDDPTPDSFAVSLDGGAHKRSTKYANRVVQAKCLKDKSPIFARLSSIPESLRRYTPKKDVAGVWTISLVPCFENTYRIKGEIGASDSGIYRYRLGGETVYLGRGRLVSRFAEPHRNEWQFDAIEYSILNDETEETRWESHWLEQFREEHNRWPVYNRIGGMRVVQESTEERGFG
jgi:hypothetical protein